MCSLHRHKSLDQLHLKPTKPGFDQDMDECVLSKLKNHKQLLISKWRSRLIAAEEQYLYTLSQSDVGGRRQVQTNDKVNREKVSIHARTHPSHSLHLSMVLMYPN